MQEKTLKALHWIIDILDKHNVPYRIGGGFAAHVYGSNRPINDIDFSLSGKYFPIIMSDISPYIEYNLKHYSGEKWDCDGLTLNYHGQEIDMTDIDTLRMSNKELTKWFQTKDNFRKFPNFITVVNEVEISLIDPRDLVAYKKELADEDHQYQLMDIKAVEQYISNHNILNIKTLKFIPELVNKILSGEKTSTWRLFDDKNLTNGDKLIFINKETLKEFGEAVITSLKIKTLGSLTDDDWIGHEKFSSEKEMYESYKKYYGDKVNKNSEVKIITFEFKPLKT